MVVGCSLLGVSRERGNITYMDSIRRIGNTFPYSLLRTSKCRVVVRGLGSGI